MGGFCYHYDGSYPGFLCCIGDIFRYREPPALFVSPEADQPSLYPDRWVETRPDYARRLDGRLAVRLGKKGRRMVWAGFLTCMPDKEQRLYDFIRYGLRAGPGVENHLAQEPVLLLTHALRHLAREAELLTGFLRFTDCGGVLAGQIHPKNQVLPLLQIHLGDRFAQENYLVYDATHRQLLVHQKGRYAILPVDDWEPPPPSGEERAYRALWRRFYDTIAIEGRYNPKCRQSHMPKRYWGDMTEFQTEEDGPLAIADSGTELLPTSP